jgi:hypothetical protein
MRVSIPKIRSRRANGHTRRCCRNIPQNSLHHRRLTLAIRHLATVPSASRGLLGARGKRIRRRHSAEQRDELAAFSIDRTAFSPLPANQAAGYRIGEGHGIRSAPAGGLVTWVGRQGSTKSGKVRTALNRGAVGSLRYLESSTRAATSACAIFPGQYSAADSKRAASTHHCAALIPRARLAPGTITLPLCSRANASPFWIMLLLVLGRWDHGMIRIRHKDE